MSRPGRMKVGDVRCIQLAEESARAYDRVHLERRGRHARTVFKRGPLTVALVRLRPGGRLPAHRARGPFTVQVLEGGITLRASRVEPQCLVPGDLLAAASGVEYDVTSATGAALVLTTVQAPACGIRVVASGGQGVMAG